MMSEFAQSGGGYVERDVNFCPQHGGCEINFLDIHQNAWSEPYFMESRVVLSQRLSPVSKFPPLSKYPPHN